MQRRPTEKWAAVISRRKVYVYLDTTRGLHHRHGRQDVPDRGTRHRLRLPGVGNLRCDFDAAGAVVRPDIVHGVSTSVIYGIIHVLVQSV